MGVKRVGTKSDRPIPVNLSEGRYAPETALPFQYRFQLSSEVNVRLCIRSTQGSLHMVLRSAQKDNFVRGSTPSGAEDVRDLHKFSVRGVVRYGATRR